MSSARASSSVVTECANCGAENSYGKDESPSDVVCFACKVPLGTVNPRSAKRSSAKKSAKKIRKKAK